MRLILLSLWYLYDELLAATYGSLLYSYCIVSSASNLMSVAILHC